ncbi:hypothetical protein Zmor_001689 [Zophobas morio]|uniref:CHK kinase-like domain-containing protein n=1 Tax=Zophobas morio TaxID=2755281 RepID=A0AA38J5N3_9CUCU|nr:hypothetical protein Zmor_001689 [Zophobas morio]
MGSTNDSSENEIRSWLKIVLKDENFKDISVKIQGNSEKGDGTADNQSSKNYDLVLKCSKKSQALRETSPVKEAFLNEIFMYQKVLPCFFQHQKDKGVKAPYNSVPKCYGSFTGENMEVIVLDNLKSKGYELWPRKQPLSRRHIDLVVTEYGKYHATSLVVQHQRPTEFQIFVDAVNDIMEKFTKTGNMESLFGTPIDQSSELLKNDLDESILLRWKGLKNQIKTVFDHTMNDSKALKVILHGDSWNNNFMFLYESGEEKIPLKVAFLDWQVSRYASPIVDLSYFLFACLSKDDFEELDDILVRYHTAFIGHLVQLQIEKPETLYPLDQFLAEWKQHYKDEVLDIAEVAESGKQMTDTFANEIRDKENYKRRILPIVEYAANHNLI